MNTINEAYMLESKDPTHEIVKTKKVSSKSGRASNMSLEQNQQSAAKRNSIK